jgi:hypothetical protein
LKRKYRRPLAPNLTYPIGVLRDRVNLYGQGAAFESKRTGQVRPGVEELERKARSVRRRRTDAPISEWRCCIIISLQHRPEWA